MQKVVVCCLRIGLLCIHIVHDYCISWYNNRQRQYFITFAVQKVVVCCLWIGLLGINIAYDYLISSSMYPFLPISIQYTPFMRWNVWNITIYIYIHIFTYMLCFYPNGHLSWDKMKVTSLYIYSHNIPHWTVGTCVYCATRSTVRPLCLLRYALNGATPVSTALHVERCHPCVYCATRWTVRPLCLLHYTIAFLQIPFWPAAVLTVCSDWKRQ